VEQQFYYNPAAMMPYSDVFLQGALYDRNQIVGPTQKIKLITPLGQLTQTNGIYDICLNRANELAKLVENTDKKIHVFWSGGLDSTAVLMSLREVAPSNKIVVLYAPESLVEYPGFFEQHVQGTFETFEFSMGTVWKAVEFACANGIAVTGEIGDQIYGSVLYLDREKDWLTQSWENFNAEITSNEIYHRFVQACPQKITTTAEFLWWVNYSMKYQLVQCRMLLNNTVSELNKNFFHFFDSKEFNDYAVSTPMEEKMPGYGIAAYKKPLRDVIYKLSNDAVYSYTKPKVRSLVPVYGRFSRHKMAFAINTDWKRYYVV
jgi:hypothetical protein